MNRRRLKRRTRRRLNGLRHQRFQILENRISGVEVRRRIHSRERLARRAGKQRLWKSKESQERRLRYLVSKRETGQTTINSPIDRQNESNKILLKGSRRGDGCRRTAKTVREAEEPIIFRFDVSFRRCVFLRTSTHIRQGVEDVDAHSPGRRRTFASDDCSEMSPMTQSNS